MPAPLFVLWTGRARSDLEAIRQYIALDNPFAADRLADRLVQAGERLRDFPEIGRVEGDTRVLTTVAPYLIRYRMNSKSVIIVGVRHGRRQA